ncbi:Os02g0782550, partial [Oryza sativa Japonica Group]
MIQAMVTWTDLVFFSGGGRFLTVTVSTPFSHRAEMPPVSASSGRRNLRANALGDARRSRRMYLHSPSSSSRFRFPFPAPLLLFITSTLSSSSRPGTSSTNAYSPGVSMMSTGAPPPIPLMRCWPCPCAAWCAWSPAERRSPAAAP